MREMVLVLSPEPNNSKNLIRLSLVAKGLFLLASLAIKANANSDKTVGTKADRNAVDLEKFL